MVYTRQQIESYLPLGYRLISPENVENQMEKLNIICDRGHSWDTARIGSLKGGHKCKQCSIEDSRLVVNVGQFAKKNSTALSNYEILNYQNIYNITAKCLKCDNILKSNYASLKRGCGFCREHDLFGAVLADARKEGYQVELVKCQKSGRTRIEGFCPKGHPYGSAPDKWRSGKRCKHCAGVARLPTEYVKESLATEKYELLTDYVNSQSFYQVKCPKGHTYTGTFNGWTHGYRCPECFGIKVWTPERLQSEFTDHPVFSYISGIEGYFEYIKDKSNRRQNYNFQVRCHKRGHISSISFEGLIYEKWGCAICTRNTYRSKAEIAIAELVESWGFKVIRNDREQLKGLELDIYLPEQCLAIEYCGLYYHSDLFKDPNSHQNKYLLCKELGIKLLTIFEDEWVYQEHKVIDILRHELKMEEVTLIDCELKQHESTWSLFFNSQLVAIATAENGRISLTRTNFYVNGGFNYLISTIQNQLDAKNLVVVFDNRYPISLKQPVFEENIIKPKSFYVAGRRRSPEPTSMTIFDCGETILKY